MTAVASVALLDVCDVATVAVGSVVLKAVPEVLSTADDGDADAVVSVPAVSVTAVLDDVMFAKEANKVKLTVAGDVV